MPNQLFYGGQLQDGCSAAQRRPLVSGVPELLCLNAPGSCLADSHSQVCPRYEWTESVCLDLHDTGLILHEPQHTTAEYSDAIVDVQSCSNRAEAAAIATVVRRLQAAGVPATALGVICFFRAQVPLCLAQRAKLRDASTELLILLGLCCPEPV